MRSEIGDKNNKNGKAPFFISMRIAATIVSAAAMLSASAQIGTNAYSFLDVASSTHAQGLGGYGIAIASPEVMLSEQNPGLLGSEIGRVVGLSYMRYFGSSNFASVRFAHSAGEHGAWGVGLKYVDYGSIDGYTSDGSFTGTFKPQDIAVDGTYAHDFTERLRGGISVKMIYSNYEDFTAMALAADLGINYYDPDHNLSLSAVIKNAGGQVKRFNESYDHLPFDIQLGYMQGLGGGPFSIAITAHNLTHWNMPYYVHDDEDQESKVEEADSKFIPNFFRHLTFGLQYSPSDAFYVCVGYNYKTRTDMSSYQRSFFSGISLGLGLNVKDFEIGVSYSQPHKSASTLGLNLAYYM